MQYVRSCRGVLGVLLLVGCEAALGLNDYGVERAMPAAGVTGAAAGGVSTGAGGSPIRTIERVPQNRGDGGMALRTGAADAAVGGDARAAKGVTADADAGAAQLRPDAASAGVRDEDAGSEVDVTLGSTGLREREILGYYSGEWGQMVLRKHADELWGVYEYRAGTIIGEINSEGVFVGWWTQTPTRAGAADSGEVEFRWSRVGDTTIALDGRWRYGTDGEWLDNWDLCVCSTALRRAGSRIGSSALATSCAIRRSLGGVLETVAR